MRTERKAEGGLSSGRIQRLSHDRCCFTAKTRSRTALGIRCLGVLLGALVLWAGGFALKALARNNYLYNGYNTGWVYVDSLAAAEQAGVASIPPGYGCSGYSLSLANPQPSCPTKTWSGYPYNWDSCYSVSWNYASTYCTNYYTYDGTSGQADVAIIQQSCNFGYIFDDSVDGCVPVFPVARQVASCTYGDPCDAATGNEHHVEVDYEGTGPSPLKFVRSYNSLTGSSGILGADWSSTYGGSAATGGS